jgi:haloacetate dehalogenase
MFEGFERVRVDVRNGVFINAVKGGSGPPLLLLHGYPQTHVIWHKTAPRLAERFTVVASDLRGYGDSSKPAGLADHSNYSKREMAKDQVTLMEKFGFDKFYLAGHDRGGRVSHRLAMDYPERVLKLAVLDISPTLKMYETTTDAFARAYWHWFFLIQAAPLPETMIAANPELYLRSRMSRGDIGLSHFTDEAWHEYVRCFDVETIYSSCEDYRAAAMIDLVHDRDDKAKGRKLELPLLALWGAKGAIEKCFNPLSDWREVANDVQGHSLPCGHYLPEEEPEGVLKGFLEFFGGKRKEER